MTTEATIEGRMGGITSQAPDGIAIVVQLEFVVVWRVRRTNSHRMPFMWERFFHIGYDLVVDDTHLSF